MPTTLLTEFSESLRTEIESRVLATLLTKKPGERAFAAFDADGTLWDTDIGENFFFYQIKNCGLKNLPVDPWQHYLDLKKIDRIKAYYWLAQINVGQKLSQVHAWAQAAVDKMKPIPILNSSASLVQFLRKNGVEVFVVTASVKWAVEPAAALLGIDRDHVLGMSTEIENGIVSDRCIPPATYKQGKADAVLLATGGVAPLLCAGNTIGDTALLSCSSAVKLALRTQGTLGSVAGENHLLEDEIGLQNEAIQNAWLRHAFRE